MVDAPDLLSYKHSYSEQFSRCSMWRSSRWRLGAVPSASGPFDKNSRTSNVSKAGQREQRCFTSTTSAVHLYNVMLFFVDTLLVLAVAATGSSARNLPNLLHGQSVSFHVLIEDL